MRQLLLLLSLSPLLTWGQSNTAPNVVFDRTTLDFQTINEADGIVEGSFTYTNLSNDPYVIIDVTASCGCTTPQYQKKPVEKGEKGVIKVAFDPMYRPGRFVKEIWVKSNQGSTLLTITGIVAPRPRSVEDEYPFNVGNSIRLNTLYINNLEIAKGAPFTTVIAVMNTSLAISATLSVDHATLPEGVNVTFDQPFIAAGATGQIKITITQNDYRTFKKEVSLLVNGKPIAEKILLSGAVVDNFSRLSQTELMNSPKAQFSSYYHRFNTSRVGDKLTTTFDIRNTGKTQLKIRYIESSTNSVVAKIDRLTIEPSQSTTLHITYTPKEAGYDNAQILLILNDPRNPTPTIRLVAQITAL